MRYPWFAHVRNSLAIGIDHRRDQRALDATPARSARADVLRRGGREMLANKGLSAATSAATNMQLESLVALVAAVGSFP